MFLPALEEPLPIWEKLGDRMVMAAAESWAKA